MEENNKPIEPPITLDALLVKTNELETLVLSMVSHFGEKTDATNGSILEMKNSINLFMPIFLGMAARIKALEDRLGGESDSGSQQTAPGPNPNPKTPPNDLAASQSTEQEVDYQPRAMGKIEQEIARARAKAYPHLNRPTLSRG